MEGIFPSPAEAETEEEMFTMPTIDMVATGRNIMRLREAAGLTVRDLQDIFGFATPQAIYKWQHGTAMPTIDAMGFENPQAIYKWISGRSLPSLDNFVILSRLLHTSIEDILVVDGDVVRLWGIIHDHRKPDCGFSMVLNRWYNDKASVMH